MTRLWHIGASPRGASPESLQIAETFLDLLFSVVSPQIDHVVSPRLPRFGRHVHGPL